MADEVGFRIWGVVPAAGIGRRFGERRPKQYLPIAGRAAVEWSVRALLAVPVLEGVVVALAPDDPFWPPLSVAQDRRVFPCTGGAERADSVGAALDRLLALGAAPEDRVLIHDAARPALRDGDVQRLLDAVGDDPDGGLLAVPVRDTLRRAGDDGRAIGTVSRDGLWQAQTPQYFPLGRLRAALAAAAAAGRPVTDETQAMEIAGARPRLVEGAPDNIKLTHPSDLALLRSVLAARRQAAASEDTGA